MFDSSKMIIETMPWTVVVVLCLFLAALVAGWISSVIAGFRSPQGKGLRLLLLFPLTNPLALLILAMRHSRLALVPMLFYGCALLSLPVGGAVAERLERHWLEAEIRAGEEAGENLSAASLRSAPVPDEENAWAHPFLEPLARAAQPGTEGEATRASLAEHYGVLTMPQPQVRSRLRYTDEAVGGGGPRETTFLDTFREFHRSALATQDEREWLEQPRFPESWSECGDLLLEHFEPAAGAFDELAEAVARSHAVYPHEWEQGFNLLLPHLSKLKTFTQCATWRAIGRISQGQNEDALDDVNLALKLVELGDSDVLISRLVEWALATITLQGFLVGQQSHAWTADEWASLQAQLEAWDFPGQVPASMRAERVLGHVTMFPVLSQSVFEIHRSLNGFAFPDGHEDAKLSTGTQAVEGAVDFMVGGLARACLVNQWRLALDAYEDLIRAVESAVERSKVEPWSTLEVAELPKPVEEYGFIARMFLPALDGAFRKSLDIQTNIRVAIVACALERYHQVRGSYPETLEVLPSELLKLAPLDPMTRQPWSYTRTGEHSFRLYSVGRNGIDDGGVQTRGALSQSEPRKDDKAWVIEEGTPQLPTVVIDPPTVSDTDAMQLPEEMLRRYGLEPTAPSKP